MVGLKMNKKLLISLVIFPAISFAQDIPFAPTPYSSGLRGIHIVPLEQINIPAEIKQNIKINLSNTKNNKYDYENTDSQRAKNLLNIKERAHDDFVNAHKYAKYGVYDTSMKHSYKEIKLSIPFEGIKGVPEKDIIGYAAINSFVQDKGWNGIRVFFSNDKLGNCSYQYYKIISVMLAEENVEYLVNKKPGSKSISGNQNTGFNYNVTWYEDDANGILDCANKDFKPEIMDGVIKLANVIDKN
jgi:hypothetical protein